MISIFWPKDHLSSLSMLSLQGREERKKESISIRTTHSVIRATTTRRMIRPGSQSMWGRRNSASANSIGIGNRLSRRLCERRNPPIEKYILSFGWVVRRDEEGIRTRPFIRASGRLHLYGMRGHALPGGRSMRRPHSGHCISNQNSLAFSDHLPSH